MGMNARQTIKLELEEVQERQALLVTEYGHVRTGRRYEYQELTKQAAQLRECLLTLDKITQ